MKQNQQLVLIDGNNFLYRAYYSTVRASLTNSKGQPTGATKVYINMIKKLEKKYPEAVFAVVFDAHGPCFRHELYAEYKGTRKPMPDDLRAQVDTIKNIITAMGLPIISVKGVEADDVLGSYAVKAAGDGYQVYLATGDKDLASMVNDSIFIVNTMDDTVLDRDGVIEKFGVPPELISDFLALKGDTADNIPGMTGIGDKSATMLLNSLGNIHNIEQHLDEVKNLSFRGAKTFADNFRKQIDNIRLSLILTTIKTDVDLPYPLQELRKKNADHRKLLEIYTECEFKDLIKLEKQQMENEQKHQSDTGIQSDLFSPPAMNENTDRMESSPDRKTNLQNQKIPVTVLAESSLTLLVKEMSVSSQLFIYPLKIWENVISSKLVGLAVETANCSFYIPVGHYYLNCPSTIPATVIFDTIGSYLSDSSKEIIAYNVKELMHILDSYGIILRQPFHDVMLEAHSLNSALTLDIPSLATQFLETNVEDEYALTTIYETVTGRNGKENRKKKKIPLFEVEINQAADFCRSVVSAINRLHNTIFSKLQQMPENFKSYCEIELPLVEVLYSMEKNGFYLDRNEFSNQSKILNAKLDETQKNIWLIANKEFNINSPKEVATVLYDHLGIECPKKTPTGQPSTSEEVLSEIAENYEIARLILDYRALAKLINTYVDKLPEIINSETHRIHGVFHQEGTSTGRLSSSDPNLQNIPVRTPEGRAIRAGFAAPDGYKIVAADYSQIELRLMAHIAHEQNMINAFNHHSDIHASTAAQIHNVPIENVTPEMRRSAKAINFGLMYGMNTFGLAKRLNISRETANIYITSYFNRFPGVKQYMADIKKSVHESGYVTTILGQKLNFEAIKTAPKMAVSGIERAAINAPMQGSAAEIIKMAMIKIAKWIDEQPAGSIKMLLQVHDELIFEIKDEFVEKYSKIISEIMSSVIKLDIPLEVSVGIGKNWSEAH